MSFKNIQAGDRITFFCPNGITIQHGVGSVQQYSKKTAKVNPLLIFEDHVVVNWGNNGAVVDEENFIKAVRKGARS